MKTARAGWTETDITPPLGLPMGGRGPRFAPGASVLDPLNAQVLVLEDAAGRRTLWVSMDHVGITRNIAEPLRCELASMAGVPLDAVVLNFSHTHSGPMATFDGYATVVPRPEALTAYEGERDRKIVRAACEALEKLRPVAALLHRGRSDIGINRRRRNAAGEVGLGPNPDAVYNPDLWVLDIADQIGDGRCILFSYGCHPVTVYGFSWDGISADYPGACRKRLRDRFGESVHCQFIQGLAGNVRPRALADLAEGKFRKPTSEDPESVGAQLADDVAEALNRPGEMLELDIAAAASTFLVHKNLSANPPAETWQSVAEEEDELRRNLGRYWVERLEAGIPPIRALPWDIGMVRLTPEHHIAWIAGEPMAEWLGYLRLCLDDERLFVWGYCQNASGYLPTDELLSEGGYEVRHSNQHYRIGPGPFAEGLNDAAGDAFLALKSRIERD